MKPDTLRESAPAGGGRRVLGCGRVSLLVHPRSMVVTATLGLVILGVAAVALAIGSVAVPIAHLPGALLGWETDPTAVRVVQQIRLPRVCSAIAAGAALGVSGALFQSVSRNVLGSPDVIGFTTGAATGALVQIVLFGGSGSAIALGAFVGGIVTAAIVMLLSRRAGALRGRQLVLVGIGVGAVLAAANGLLLVKGDLESAASANLWLSGSLDARKWEHALPALAAVVLVVPVVLLFARQGALLESGDDLARQLGVRAERVRLVLVCCAVLLAAAATGAVGSIAFVALAAPQLVRRLNGTSATPLIGAAAMGAALLLVADLVTQLLPVTFSVPIGRMTGILGGIYLIWLLLPSRGRVQL